MHLGLPSQSFIAFLSVAGCTAGIGKSYANELASRGVNVILISWNKEQLDAVARDIADTYKVETVVIVADFRKGREIYPVIEKGLMGKEIGILVNNVSVFYDRPDYFTNLTQDKIWEIVNINIGATTMMTHILLPEMVDRRKGAIVNIASLSCCQPTPLMSAYSASKVQFKIYVSCVGWVLFLGRFLNRQILYYEGIDVVMKR